MGGKSVFGNVMLVVIAVILFVGFYLLIGAVDVFRLREERLVSEVTALNSEVSRLSETLAGGGFKPAASIGAGAESALPKFANMELRDPKAVEGDALVVAMQAESGNLNAIINNEASVQDFWGMCTDSLAERSFVNPDVFEPKLAEKWEISDDKLTYTIHLRKGVLWHDFTDPTTHKKYENVEVTADDFKFFADVVQNPKIPCDFLRVYFKDLKDLRVVDRYTFQVTWKQPYWKSEELTLGLNPLPRQFYQFDPDKPDEFTDNTARNDMIVGCGPWIFESWEKGKQLTFRRNEAYYAPKPYLLRRMVKIIREPTASLQALRNGEIDEMSLLPEQWVDQIKDKAFNDKFAKFEYPARAFSYIGYNMRRDLFKDKRVRLALTRLVNRERILKEVYHGLGRIVTGPFYIDSSSYDPSIKPWPFDVDKAKALLAEAGWTAGEDGILRKDGRKFEFTYMVVSSSKLGQQVAAIVRDDFAKAGIIVNINPIEWSIYTERLDTRSFNVCQLGWQLDWADDPYQIWYSAEADTPKGSNAVGFKNAEADQIIVEARREFDPAKRAEMYHRLDRILHEEQPYTFLISPEALVALDKRFHNAKVWKPFNELYPDTYWVPKETSRSTRNDVRNYILKRLLFMVVTLLVITVVSYTMMRLAPGDPIRAQQLGSAEAGMQRTSKEENLGEKILRQKYHLDRNPIVGYGYWIKGILTRFDWGDSLVVDRGAPVLGIIAERLPATLKLETLSVILIYICAIPIGIYSAIRRNTPSERAITVALFLLYSLPTFWTGLLMLVFFCGDRFLNIFSVAGLSPDSYLTWGVSYWRILAETARHYVLPVVCLSYASLAGLSRYARVGILEIVRQDYIRTARRKACRSGWSSSNTSSATACSRSSHCSPGCCPD